MKAIILSLLLATSAFAAQPKGSQYKGKEELQNLVCARVERIYKEYDKRVKCFERNGDYTIKIWSNYETVEIDFLMANVVFLNSTKVVPILAPKSLKVVNNYGVERKLSYRELERKYTK